MADLVIRSVSHRVSKERMADAIMRMTFIYRRWENNRLVDSIDCPVCGRATHMECGTFELGHELNDDLWRYSATPPHQALRYKARRHVLRHTKSDLTAFYLVDTLGV